MNALYRISETGHSHEQPEHSFTGGPPPTEIGRHGPLIGCLLSIFLFLGLNSGLVMAQEIITPKDGAIIYARQPTTHMVISQKENRGLKQLRVSDGNIVISALGVWQESGTYYVHFRIPLRAGKNRFEILPSGKKITIKYRPLRSLLNANFNAKNVYLFHRDKLLPKACTSCHDPNKITPNKGLSGEAQPLCYSCHKNILEKTTWQHSPAANTLCLACHQESTKPMQITIPKGKVEAVCFKCHVNQKNWLNMGHVHGPVGTGDCTVCHNPHGDNNHSQLWADGKVDICVACHTDKKELTAQEGETTQYAHGILSGSGCVACHSPHATENRFQLYKPINELCTGCHPSFKGVTRGHPVGGHPVDGVLDPRRPERMFSCTSCHNPHGSDYRFLLIGDILGGHVCSQCHY